MAPRIRHLNCATLCPRGLGEIVCHCLLVETDDGLVLVDGGLGSREIANEKLMPWAFRKLLRPRGDITETARAQIAALGYSTSDLRHIIVTHLDLDHAGVIADFPHATVHVHARERDAALHPELRERMRYMRWQWHDHQSWETYGEAGDHWFGFASVTPLVGLGDDVALIPLFGHTRGHSGVAVRGESGWFLHAGDAYFCEGDLTGNAPRALRAFQSAVEMNRAERIRNRDRLSALAREHGAEVTVFCAHDPTEFTRLRDRSLPAGQ